MAITISYETRRAVGFRPQIDAAGLRTTIGTFTTTGNYVTGGWDFDLSSKFRTLLGVFIVDIGGDTLAYDATNKKIKHFTATGTEHAETPDALTDVLFQAFGLG